MPDLYYVVFLHGSQLGKITEIRVGSAFVDIAGVPTDPDVMEELVDRIETSLGLLYVLPVIWHKHQPE